MRFAKERTIPDVPVAAENADMSSSETQATGDATFVWRRIAAWTSAIGVLLAFLGGIEAMLNKSASYTCYIATNFGISLPWCAPPDRAEAWSLEAGGSPGKPFGPLVCSDGEALVGVFGRAGVGPFIRAIGPVCTTARFDRHHELVSSWSAVRKGDPVVGTSRGDSFDLLCPNNMVVVGYELDSSQIHTSFDGKDAGWHEYLVAPMSIRCASGLSTDAKSKSTVSQVGQPQDNANRMPFQCANGSGAFGIKGTFGNFINTVGFGCRRM
jgi:hypothetical protein